MRKILLLNISHVNSFYGQTRVTSKLLTRVSEWQSCVQILITEKENIYVQDMFRQHVFRMSGSWGVAANYEWGLGRNLKLWWLEESELFIHAFCICLRLFHKLQFMQVIIVFTYSGLTNTGITMESQIASQVKDVWGLRSYTSCNFAELLLCHLYFIKRFIISENVKCISAS